MLEVGQGIGMYHVTGITVRGARFRIITSNIMHAYGINLYKGTVWKVEPTGKRTILKRVGW